MNKNYTHIIQKFNKCFNSTVKTLKDLFRLYKDNGVKVLYSEYNLYGKLISDTFVIKNVGDIFLTLSSKDSPEDEIEIQWIDLIGQCPYKWCDDNTITLEPLTKDF